MPRLDIAHSLYQKLLVIDHDAFLQDPYRQAQRALMWADTLIAAHKLTDPCNPPTSMSEPAQSSVGIDVSVRAAKADFALRKLTVTNRRSSSH